MKKLILILFISVGFCSFSQQIPQFSHYLLNQFAFNPAAAGSKDCFDVTLGHRTQWSGLDGAPRTTFGSFNTVLSQDKFGLGYKHAVGLVVLQDSYGPFSRTKLKGAYAYHLPVNKKTLLSMGIFIGIEQIRFDASELEAINFNDDAINNSQRATIFPEFTPGFMLQSEKWFAGGTLQQTLAGPKKVVGTDQTQFSRHLTLLGGLNLNLNDDWSFIPSTMFKFTRATPWAIDINAMFDYKNKFWVGIGYRNTDAAIALVSFNVFDYFKLGYAFDYTVSKIRFGSFNTHEVSLSINPCGFKEDPKYGCPTFN